MIPIHEFHSNADVFGANVDQFNPTRFLDTDLHKSFYFKPFGGGVTICTGRYLAKRMTLVHVALLLQRFNFEIVGRNEAALENGEFLPHEIDNVTPNMGIMAPKKGQEMYVNISERNSG